MWRLVRWRPAVGVIAVAVVLAACSSSDQSSTAGHHASTTSHPGANPAPRGPGVSASPALCAAPEISVHGGRQGGGFVGVALGMMVLTNTATRACLLTGYPRIVLLGQKGAALDIQAPPAPEAGKDSVVVSAGHSASMNFDWTNWCSGAPGPLRISVTPDGTTGSLVGPFDGPPGYDFVPGCRDSSQPSTLEALMPYRPFTQGN